MFPELEGEKKPTVNPYRETKIPLCILIYAIFKSLF